MLQSKNLTKKNYEICAYFALEANYSAPQNFVVPISENGYIMMQRRSKTFYKKSK